LFYRSSKASWLSEGAEGKMNKTRRINLSFARFSSQGSPKAIPKETPFPKSLTMEGRILKNH
jgi:hypothetical protein